jgi:enoyl-CoA hydratase/carnithine racemase
MADLEIEDRGQVRILRINRPDARNAMSPAVIDGLGFAVHDADNDPEVRAMVLTGTGDRAFCAGMDLRGFADGSTDATERDPRGIELFLQLRRDGSQKPLIGAANATAVAGGFELLMQCDVVIASEDARFGLPEVKRGLLPAGGGLFLGTRIPMAIASELLLTGDTIDARRAYDLGLVNRVVPAADVLTEAIAMAERIAANGPLAVKAIKQVVHATATLPAAEAWAVQDSVQPAVFASEDAKEGALAFVERRPPVWRGR